MDGVQSCSRVGGFLLSSISNSDPCRPKVSMSESLGLFEHQCTEVQTTGTAAGAGAG